MSVQIFLQAKLLGIEEFLAAPAPAGIEGTDAEALFIGRSQWVTLLAEVLPRALLAELGLARILLGTSGGGQFLVVLPEVARGEGNEFLAAAGAGIRRMSAGRLRLTWAVTENLGDWSDVRKRLTEEMRRLRGAPAAAPGPETFEPAATSEAEAGEFLMALARGLREAATVGWSPEAPAEPVLDGGKHNWSLTAHQEGIALARHAAPSDDSRSTADAPTLAGRAAGRPAWGVLRGDVDNFGIRLRRAQTIEEHLQLSIVYKQFFAGELEVLCSMPEFWRRLVILYSGGDDFAVYGAWDALIALAREIQRLFRRFAEEHLKDFPGPEGKTVSMALALARRPDTPIESVYSEAGRLLEQVKSAGKDCFHLFGRTLEWKHLADAADIKDTMTRMIGEFGCPPQILDELGGFYRETPWAPDRMSGARGKEDRFDKPWRFHWRINRMVGATRDRELQKLRASLVGDLVGKSAAQWRLRPSGRVALEWARMRTEV
jgi:CRISPR-associated protein Csm1